MKNRKWIWIILLCALVLAAAIILPPILSRSGEDPVSVESEEVLDQVYRQLTAEEMERFKAFFEQPEYNVYIRAKHWGSRFEDAYRSEAIRMLVEERFRASDEVEEATEPQRQAYEAATGDETPILWRMRKKTAEALTDTYDEYPDWYWDPKDILVELDGDPGYCYYAPVVEIEEIEPAWGTVRADYGSTAMNVDMRYWTVDEAGERVQYEFAFTWDRAADTLLHVGRNTPTFVKPEGEE